MSMAQPLGVRASTHALDSGSLEFQAVAQHFLSTAGVFEIVEIRKNEPAKQRARLIRRACCCFSFMTF